MDNTEILAGMRERLAIQLHTFERSILRVVEENSPCNCMWEELPEHFKKLFLQNADQILSLKIDNRYALMVVDTKAELPESGCPYLFLDGIRNCPFPKEGWMKVIE